MATRSCMRVFRDRQSIIESVDFAPFDSRESRAFPVVSRSLRAYVGAPPSLSTEPGDQSMTIAVSEEPSDSAGTFPIVAVGCSAGGLEASMDLLGSLPADAGVAIILLQHLDPTRPSSLSDLLSKVSAMTVETATAGVLIQGNRVYVIPPM